LPIVSSRDNLGDRADPLTGLGDPNWAAWEVLGLNCSLCSWAALSGTPDWLRATRDLCLLRSHRSWGPTPWRSLALTGLPYPVPLAPVLQGCVPQPWSPSVTSLCPSYNPSPLSPQLLVGLAVGTRCMYYVRSCYKMLTKKKKKKKSPIQARGSMCIVGELWGAPCSPSLPR
jgi:hypothetical protein